MWYNAAMAQSYTLSERLGVPPVHIHDWLNDWDHVKAWIGPDLVSIEMLSEHAESDPLCVGMRFRETRKMGKMNAKADIEVTLHEIEADGTFRHHAVFDDGCNRMICEYTYTPEGQGTVAEFKMYNAPNKWWTKAMNVVTGPLMIKMCAKHLSTHLVDLKALVENPDPASDAPQP